MNRVPGPIDERNVMEGTLHVWPSGALYVGTGAMNEPHRHFTASVIVARTATFRVRAGDGPWAPTEAVLVAPNVEQELDARGAALVILQVDPESDEFSRLSQYFEAGKVHFPSGDTLARVKRVVRSFDGDRLPAYELYKRTLDELSVGSTPRRPVDSRIRRVLGIIKSEFLASPSAADLASRVGLSEGRLIHLFTKEMGLPIRRYILWLRLRDVVVSLAAGHTLTEAAHRAGFSDSPHLSRTFRTMFGFPPSAIADSRGRVRISVDLGAVLGAPSPHPALDRERLARVKPKSSGSTDTE